MAGFARGIQVPRAGEAMHGFGKPLDVSFAVGIEYIATGKSFEHQTPVRFSLIGMHKVFAGRVMFDEPMADHKPARLRTDRGVSSPIVE